MCILRIFGNFPGEILVTMAWGLPFLNISGLSFFVELGNTKIMLLYYFIILPVILLYFLKNRYDECYWF